jgi:hypothetical protein
MPMKASHASNERQLRRREFLQNAGLLSAIGSAAGGLAVPSLGWGEEFSGAIDCGPPVPPKNSVRPTL